VISRILPLALLLALWPGSVWPQDVLTIQELELQYSSKVRQHQAAFDAWKAMEIRLGRALDSVTAADDSGNEDRRNRAFTVFRQLAGENSVQERRVEQIAEELRAARADLLMALGQRLEELTQQADSAVDSQERRELAAILNDRNNRYLELRAEEAPETTLEPMQDITIDPRDTPDLIIRKAELLDRGSFLPGPTPLGLEPGPSPWRREFKTWISCSKNWRFVCNRFGTRLSDTDALLGEGARDEASRPAPSPGPSPFLGGLSLSGSGAGPDCLAGSGFHRRTLG